MYLRIRNILLSLMLAVALLPSTAAGQGTERGFFPPQQMGAGAGPYFSMTQFKLPELDTQLAGMGLEGIPEWLDMYGAGGGMNLGFFWIGGFELSGTVKRTEESGGTVREAYVDLSQSGLAIGFVKSAGNIKLTAGSLIGAGRMDIRLVRRPSAAGSWSGTWTYYGTGFTGTVDAADMNISTRLEGKYFLLEPYLSLRYWPVPLVAFDLGATYRIGTIGSGKLRQNGEKIPGSPEFKMGGMGFRFGIFFGF